MKTGLEKTLAPVPPGLPSESHRSQSTGTEAVPPLPVAPISEGPARTSPGKASTESIAIQLQEFLQSSERDLEFRVDADTKAQVITVRDATSGEVIRQMPSEEVLRVLKNISAVQGAFLDELV